MHLVAFDTETTGTDPENDRIVELCLAPQGAPVETFRVNPGVPIPAGATAVHGITDADVRDAPTFADIAPKVQAIVDGAVLLGYNSRSFDTPLLDAELRRAGQPGLGLDSVQEIDVLRLWNAVEPRTLTGAVQRFLGRTHDGAHEAHADVRATLDVWQAISSRFDLDAEACIAHTRPRGEVDRAGKFVRDDEGRVCYNFGKHAGMPVARVDPSYLQWMSTADFPTGTKAVVARLIEHGGDLPR